MLRRSSTLDSSRSARIYGRAFVRWLCSLDWLIFGFADLECPPETQSDGERRSEMFFFYFPPGWALVSDWCNCLGFELNDPLRLKNAYAFMLESLEPILRRAKRASQSRAQRRSALGAANSIIFTFGTATSTAFAHCDCGRSRKQHNS